jgi:putative tricarboxylic transport membrane protein
MLSPMLESVLTAFALMFTFKGILFLALGVGIGLVFGVIPGLGGATAIALLTPLSYGMDPNLAITLFGGIMGSVAFGGSISAILLNTPGIAPNAATCFDGFPLSKQGKAGMAIGAAATASALGALIGVAVLVAVIPVAKEIVILFGPPEFFALAILGLSAIALSTGGKFLRGLIAGEIGFALAFVGYDAVNGGTRFTGGMEYLFDGIKLVPALTGLFAIAEMVNITIKGGTIAGQSAKNIRISRVSDGIRAVFENYPILLRGSAIGAFVGAIPGVGGTVAAFLAYASTVQADKNPESFGKGNIRGVIAPEAANNAKDGGALIPTLAFGIPGSAEMAVFLGVLVLHGLEPGPLMLIEHEGVVFSLIVALAIGAVLASAVGLIFARPLALITLVDAHILVPVVVSVALVGVYALRSSVGDIIVTIIFGVVGFLMIRFDYPRITLVIALVLGELAERSYHQAIMIGDGDPSIFLHRPISLALFAIVIAILITPTWRLLWRPRRQKGNFPIRADGQSTLPTYLVPVSILVLSVGFLLSAYGYEGRTRQVPVLVGWTLVALCLLDVIAASTTRAGDAVRVFFTGTTVVLRNDEMWGEPIGKVIVAILWPTVLVTVVVTIGFVAAIPIYIFLFVLIEGRGRVGRALWASSITIGCIYVLFEKLLNCDMYQGLLFAR